MQVPKWFVIARNEYRIRTSRIRKIRAYFPIMVILILGIYVAFIAPAVVSLLIDDFIAFLLSQAALSMVQIIMFTIFIYFMIIPITDTLRQEELKQQDFLLATPIKPSDILLGEFLGEVPLYAIFITALTGLFTALLGPLGFDLIQIATIIIVFVVVLLSALWIGTVIAALLRRRLGKTARGKDIGRAIAMMIALPLVALFYAIMYGGVLEVLTNTNTGGAAKILLNLLPSSWAADLILSFANNPGNIGAVMFETLTRFGGLTVFFFASLWLGTKASKRAYSLEPATFISPRAKPDGFFYGTIKSLGGGGSLSTLIISIFKDYSRRLENLSNVAYIIGILFLVNIFIIPTVPSRPEDPPVAIIMAQFIFPVLAVMVAGGVTTQGRENIFIFRKAPSGVKRFVKARLIQSWLVVLPIAATITTVTLILNPLTTLVSLLTNIVLIIMVVAAYVAFALGLFLLNPPFSARSVKLWVNIMIVMFVSIGLFIGSLILTETFGAFLEPTSGLQYGLLVMIPLSWVVGLIFLYFGKRKLNAIE